MLTGDGGGNDVTHKSLLQERVGPGAWKRDYIYLLTPIRQWSFHVCFEVHWWSSVGKSTVHLSTLYLTCG